MVDTDWDPYGGDAQLTPVFGRLRLRTLLVHADEPRVFGRELLHLRELLRLALRQRPEDRVQPARRFVARGHAAEQG